MYEEVCYKSPYLKDVICRLDFGSKIEGFTKTLPQKLVKAVLEKFPISEPQKGQQRHINVSAAGVQEFTEDTVTWTYHGKNREKTLTISPSEMVVICKKYSTEDEFRADIEGVISTIYELEKDLTVSRLGLRYINVIELNEANPLAWSDYIEERMLGIIDMHDGKNTLSRVFHIVEFNYENIQVKFQFGMPNPDYPAVIKRKQFILDIDAYVHGALTHQDVVSSLTLAHEKIQELFESSITEKTRTMMSPVRVKS